MEREKQYGMIIKDIMEITWMIKNMEKVFLNGEMVKDMKVNGKMENNMYIIFFY